MHRFNVFKAFSGSSRDTPRPYVNYEEVGPEYHTSTYTPRRQVLTKRSRENGQVELDHQRGQVPVFTPIPSRRATVEDYDDSNATLSVDEEGPVFDSVRPPSPIPAVHREEQPSRLREVFSDSGSGSDYETRSDDESVLREGPLIHTPHPSENEALQHPPVHPIPIDPSIGTEDHTDDHTVTESVGEYCPEDTRPSSWQNFSGPLPSRGRSPQAVGIPDPRALGHDRIQAQAYNDYYEDSRNMRHQSRTDDTYYIIPSGTNVIFQDEDGNEITRVGDFGPRKSHRRTRRPTPLIVQDEYGRELYRTGEFDGASHRSRSSDRSYYHVQPNMMPVDPYDRGGHRNGLLFSNLFATTKFFLSRRSQSSHTYHPSPPSGYVDHRGRGIGPQMEIPRGPSSDRSYSSYTSSSPNYVLIDHHGRQIPLGPTSGSMSSRSGSRPSSRSGRPYR